MITKNEPGEAIFKIGAIILRGKQLLVVKKTTKDNRVEYIIPGGRPEGAETQRETLERELREELQVKLVAMDHFGSFDEIAVFENIPIHMEVFAVEIDGTPRPDSEIKEYLWIDRDYEREGIKLGTVLGRYVVPGLVGRGLM